MSFQNLWRTANPSRLRAQTMRIHKLLAPLEKKEIVPKPCETAARKLPKRCFWNLLKTKKKSCLKQGKPLRNVRLRSLQATRPNSRKRCLGRACEKAEPQQVLCPSHCETAAGKMPKRRFWNPLKRKKYMPKPCETAARKLPKRCFWNLRKIKCWMMSFQNLWRAAMTCQTSKTSVQSLRRTASETAEQQQDSCPNHAIQRPRTMPKRCLRNALSVKWASKTFGGAARKCQTSKTSVQSLRRTASETAEQQQDSCPNHAKQRPRTMPKCCLRNASKTSVPSLWRTAAEWKWKESLKKYISCSFIRHSDHAQCRNVALRNALGEQCRWMSFQNLCVQSLWRTACETAEQQQDSCPNHAKQRPRRSWMSFQNLWRTAMKCQISKTSVLSLRRTACETAEQQQDSCLNHAKQRPRKM